MERKKIYFSFFFFGAGKNIKLQNREVAWPMNGKFDIKLVVLRNIMDAFEKLTLKNKRRSS